MQKMRIINFNKIQEIMFLGVRRAAGFMGLGLNAASDSNFKNYRLVDITAADFLPLDVSEEMIEDYKKAFGEWIIMCGLRELIESFAVFLDNIYIACLLSSCSKEFIEPNKQISLKKTFCREGIKGKLKILHEQFGIYSETNKYLIYINQVRNCLAHRRGIVGITDCDTDNELVLYWLGHDVVINRLDGSEDIIKLPISKEIPVQANESIGLKFAERKVTFKLGEVIKLAPRDLAEICHTILVSGEETTKLAIDYTTNLGIELIDSK